MKTKAQRNRYNLQSVYIVNEGQSQEYYQIGGFWVPAIVVDTIKKEQDLTFDRIFTDKFEVNYHCMLFKVRNGKKLTSSKYYKRYRERLRVEHPEYLI